MKGIVTALCGLVVLSISSAGTPPPQADSAIPARYRGKLIYRRVSHFPEKLLALTFDDGPSKDITPRVLEMLAAHHAKATFFVLGGQARQNPDMLRRIAAAGHAIGNHSYSHPSSVSPERAEQEIDRTEQAIRAAVGRSPILFRPPYGITKGNLARLALKKGMTVVVWTISSADTRPIGPEVIANNVIHTPNPGDIVLMHDGPGHKATAGALPAILDQLGAAGFRFVTLPELFDAWDRWQQAHPQHAAPHK